MKQLLLIMIVLLFMSGCIFTPPANERIILINNPTLTFNEDNSIARVAKTQLGVRYLYGGMSPDGFDCSGFTCYVYKIAVGKKLPRMAERQSSYVEMVEEEALIPGDLLFFDTSDCG